MTAMALVDRIVHRMLSAALLVTPIAVAAQSSGTEAPFIDTRDFYVPGFRIIKSYDLQREEVLDGAGLVVGYRYVPAAFEEKLTGAARTRAVARLDAAMRLCLLAAHGPDRVERETGFRELEPDRMAILGAVGRPQAERLFLTGRTSYEGPGSADHGEFTCLIGEGAVISWTFRDDERRNRLR